MFIDQRCYKVSLYEDERIYLQRSRCKFIKIISPRAWFYFEATLIKKKKKNSLHLHITHIYIYSTKFLRQHSIHRSNSLKMYKHFCQGDVSSTESQCKFAPRQSYHFLSNFPPPHIQTRDDISHINPSPLPLLFSPPPLHDYYAQVSEYARAISRYTQEPAGCV